MNEMSFRSKSGSGGRQALQLTALVMAHGLATAAQAQTTNLPPASGSATNAPAKLPDVVVQGEKESGYKPETLSSPKYTEPLRDVPQTITVVPKAVMEQQGATSLRDVLRNVSGISIQAGEGGVPAGDNMSVRGFSARTDLFVDGVRDFGGYSRDPFNLEQVEVTKGPTSSTTGRGSTGGSINLVSKEPFLDRFYGGSAGFGTDEYQRYTADLNQPIPGLGVPGLAFRLNAMLHQAGVPGRDAVENRRWGVAPSLAHGLGTPTRLTLSYSRLDQDNQPDYGIPWVPANTNPALAAYSNQPAPVDFSNYYGLTDRDYEKTTTDIVTAKLEHDFTDSLSLRNLTRYGLNARDSIYTAPRFASVNTSTTITRQMQSRLMQDSLFANQTDFTAHFDTGKIGHAVVTGVEYDHEESVNHARSGPLSQTDLFNPDPDDPYPGPVTRTGARTEAVADTFSIYGFETLKLHEKLDLTGGLRWDHFGVDFKSVDTNGVPTKLQRTDEMLSWRLGIVFKPHPNGSIYAGYGTSFNPSAEGLTLGSTATAANNVNTPPEESRTFEVGTKWDLFHKRLAVNLAVFRTDKTNARTEDPTDASDVVVLAGEQRVDGVELGAAGSLTKEWRVFAGYSYLISEVTKSRNAAEEGNELSNTPRHTFNLWTTYQLPWNLEVGAGAQFVDSRYSSTANTRQAPEYWLFDAMAAYRVNDHVTLRLNVYNLANEKYIDRVGGGHFIPGAGRSAVLSANFQF
jgi:catecholate siderophore receptor